MREKIYEFVAKNRDATGFESDDGNSGFDFRREFVEDLQEKCLGTIEHAMVVERAATAEVGSGDDDAEACGFEDFNGGVCSCGMKIIVERVGPKQYRRSLRD